MTISQHVLTLWVREEGCVVISSETLQAAFKFGVSLRLGLGSFLLLLLFCL